MVVSPWPHFLAHRVGTDGLIIAKRYASQTAIGGGHYRLAAPGAIACSTGVPLCRVWEWLEAGHDASKTNDGEYVKGQSCLG